MPGTSRVSASVSAHPNFNTETSSAYPDRAEYRGEPVQDSVAPAAAPRRSIWANIRKSFGPFGRPSFIPPVPTPNLAALRGINKMDALRPGILKKRRPEAEFNMQNSPVETLHFDDEEAIEHRDIYNKPLPNEIAYAGGYAVEERRWI